MGSGKEIVKVRLQEQQKSNGYVYVSFSVRGKSFPMQTTKTRQCTSHRSGLISTGYNFGYRIVPGPFGATVGNSVSGVLSDFS